VGLGALLHDARFAPHRDLYNQEGPEGRRGEKLLRIAPEEGTDLLKTFLADLAPDAAELVRRIVLESGERLSGTGPLGLREDAISQEAQVVGLCDHYKSLCHSSPHRPRTLSHDALRELVEMSGVEFHGELIKKLWETLTLFPPGSFVSLNTGEIARVVDINRESPSRPVVKVVLSPDRQKETEEKIIDLSKTSEVSVEKAVDECALKTTDRRLLLELRAQRWWFC
jgi:hypothetical protein